MPERQQTRSLPQYVTLPEVHAMMRHARCERDRMLIWFLWHTGARISEALELRAGDLTKHGVRLVNLKQGRFVKQPDGTRKHISIREEKHVLLPAAFLAEWREYVRGSTPDAFVFQRQNGPERISRMQAWKIITRMGREAGIFKRRFSDGELRPPSPHKWRHGYAINLLEHDLPLPTIADQLGHKSIANTAIYTRLVSKRKSEMIAEVQF